MAARLILTRPRRAGALISLVPMIDVMLILLIFFMVTSTYLNLDMIPAVRQQEGGSAAGDVPGETVMIRLGSDGVPTVRGRPLPGDALDALLIERMASEPVLQVLVLPSGAAPTQALISVMDRATRAGVERLRVIRLEARP